MSQLWAPLLEAPLLEANGFYIDAYVPVVDKFREILKDTLPPGDSILFTSGICESPLYKDLSDCISVVPIVERYSGTENGSKVAPS
nr:chalcone--flavonone isomerase [Tanacetum cinerariifolium]